MDALLVTILSIGWGGFIAVIGAGLTGGLVPGRWRERAEQWEAAFDREKENSQVQREMINRTMISSEVTEKVSAAIAEIIKAGGHK